MFIFRWLLAHPIISIWSLFVLVIMLNFSLSPSKGTADHGDIKKATEGGAHGHAPSEAKIAEGVTAKSTDDAKATEATSTESTDDAKATE
ncbi:MAG: hypothetical protein KAH22_10695, partial [Thiotrichaceae bacterium]|nr:hypothetical protein [Thiotrichaceae bacterium]